MILRSLLLVFGLFSLAACNSQSGAAAGAENGSETVPVQSEYQDLSAEEFAAKMGNENTVVLDVRTPGEIAKGKIEGAVEMDYRSPTFATDVTNLDPDKTYLVYCASGGRSGKACSMLKAQGKVEVYNLAGGYRAWK